MIQIKCSNDCRSEREYIFQVLLSEFLGLAYDISFEARRDVELSYGHKSMTIDDSFFQLAGKNWLDASTLPARPLANWLCDIDPENIRLIDAEVPVLYGSAKVKCDEAHGEIGIDIFGSCFFMLSRYEEVVCDSRDEHERFKAKDSIAHKESFLTRPIVNEYLEIFWSCCLQLWPNLERKKRAFKMRVTADVDQPYAAGVKSLTRQLKQIGGDLAKRKSAGRAFVSTLNYVCTRYGNYRFDPQLNMFPWMMSVNERSGNAIDFYFITDHTDSHMDGCYSMDEEVIRQLVRDIFQRGHTIGLHPSYHTFRSPLQLNREAKVLIDVLDNENISQDTIGGRQHYLRWDPAQTAINWSDSSLSYDSSLGYAEHAGFRCGTCYEYTLYDVIGRRPLDIMERPLIAMEVSFFVYMGLGISDEAFCYMQKLKKACQLFDGDFVLLWHNSTFPSEKAKQIYCDICQNE